MPGMDLDALLARDGLPIDERLLIRMMACLWPGDQDGLRACVVAARDRDVSRTSIEELFLQGVLFCGFPRIVNGFRVLNEEWPVDTPPTGGGLPVAEQRAAGREMFDTIYGDNAPDVHAMLRGYHEEFHDFVLESAYGRVLSRPGLSPRVRELIAVGILAQTEQVPQLIAHGRGARKFGASADAVREAIYTATGDIDRSRALAERIHPG